MVELCGDYLHLQCIWLCFRVWIHSEMRTWHNKNIQSNAPNRYVLTTQFNHLNSLARWLSVCLWTKWLWVRVPLQSFSLVMYRFCRGNTLYSASLSLECLLFWIKSQPDVAKKSVAYKNTNIERLKGETMEPWITGAA